MPAVEELLMRARLKDVSANLMQVHASQYGLLIGLAQRFIGIAITRHKLSILQAGIYVLENTEEFFDRRFTQLEVEDLRPTIVAACYELARGNDFAAEIK